MAMRRTACVIGLVVIGWTRGPALAASSTAACPEVGTEKALVAAVDPRLEVRLVDGRRLRLVGIDPAAPSPTRPDLDETSRGELAESLAGKPVTVLPLADAPDRWGRVPAFVFDAGDRAGGVAVRVLAAGFGRYLAEPAADRCRGTLLDAERWGRDAKLGLWRDPYYSVLAVDDRTGFAERSATLVLAEGRLAGVRSSPYRTTLHFAAPGRQSHVGHMLVATIAPRTMKSFEAQGVDMQALIGRRLRIRGLLDLRFGPRIELQAPDQIEVLDAPPVPRADAAPGDAN